MGYRIPLLILALGLLVALLFALAPGLDQGVALYFYDAATRKFPLAINIVLVALRDLNRVIDIGFAVIIGATMLWKLWKPERPLRMSGRAIVFLTITFILAPGVMANVIFKEHWGRPRPVHVTDYGGPDRFVQWWDFGGSCRNNCSFVSGEVSAAAWTLAPASLAPLPWRPVAIAAAAVFTGVIAVVRIAAGGHFLSDTMFAALFTALIVWFVHDLIYRRGRGLVTDEAIDATLTRWGRRLRGNGSTDKA